MKKTRLMSRPQIEKKLKMLRLKEGENELKMAQADDAEKLLMLVPQIRLRAKIDVLIEVLEGGGN